MFALSELYSNGDCPSIRFFKPWWDLVIDYLNIGMMILTLIAFANVTLVDGQGIICIGIAKTYSWPQIKYLNSKCSYTFTGRLLVHYPYAIFLQWALLICIHNVWLLHPAIFSKFDAFYGIFKEMCNITPKYYRNPNTFQMASELSFDAHNQDKIEVLHVKLLYLLTESSYIITVYKVKTIASCIAGLGSTVSVVTAIYFARSFPLNFQCDFRTADIGVDPDDVSCNISPALFLYGLMMANVLEVFCVTLLSLNGIIWMIRRGLFTNTDMIDMFGSTSEYYGGMPGFHDFQLCILLLQKNIRDGNVMFETVKACIKGQVKKFKRFNYQRRGTVDEGRQLIVPNTRALEESKTFVRWIADQLGLGETENSQDSNHLFDCIRFIEDGLGVINFDVRKSTRHLIADEIEQNPLHFKTLIDKDSDVPDYETFVKHLRRETTFGKQYVLMAASYLLQVRLVIIHCHPRKKVNEVFLPYKRKAGNLTEPSSTRFLTFISPHYYHATYNLPVKADWPTILTKRRLYATDSRFRADMRNAAVRCINTLNVSNSAKSVNPYLYTDKEDNTTMEMPVMGLKRGRK